MRVGVMMYGYGSVDDLRWMSGIWNGWGVSRGGIVFREL